MALLMVEILAAVFTGANPSADVSSFFTADGPPPGSGQFLMALKPHDPAGFVARLEAVLGHIEALEGARLPGNRRLSALKEAQDTGLRVPTAYLDTARALAHLTASHLTRRSHHACTLISSFLSRNLSRCIQKTT